MAQIQVRYVAPDSETAAAVVSALETASPELSVSHLDSAPAALAALEAETVDCLVVDRLPDGGTPSIVEAARSSIPAVPVVWFTDQPADRVVDGFDGWTDYVYKRTPAQQGPLLAHRIRSVLANSETSSRTTSEEIVDRSDAGILVFDSEGKITRLNPAAESIVGLSASELIGTNCEALDIQTASDESVPLGDRPAARVLDSGEPVVDELVSIPTEAGRRWLSITASPLENGETVDGVVVTLDDVSAEVELETTLETVLDRMTDGFLAFDTDLRFTYFSRQAVDTDRYPTDELIGSRLSDLNPNLGQYAEDLQEVLDTQEPKTVETDVPEPTDAWYRARLYPSDSGVSVFFREITDEKQRERELEQYKTIVESVQDGVCILDSDLDFVFVNRAFTELVEYGEAELLGANAALVTDRDDMETARKRQANLFDNGDAPAILSGELAPKSGNSVPVETWMTPIELVDGEQGTVGVVRDLSYRRRTEATVTALYEAAHDLLSARSRQEIAEIGVEAAASALGFEDAIVLSYDEETNVFQPLAYTPSAEARLPAPLPISASDSSIAGRAFFESEPIATEDMTELPEAYNPETPYRRAMFVPLDEHGVLFVGDTETGTTSEQMRTVAELLGASLAAAFGRLSSEHRSEAHREALAERTAELEAMTHTNELVGELVDELLDASTRGEIASAVCSVVASFEQYRFAWIGAAESRSDAIVPLASAGHDEGYLDWLADHDTDGRSALHEPASRALGTNAPVSVDRIAHDWQTAPWRKEALSRGYQSAFSVPLTYDDITYGVLSIYAGGQRGFDAYTQAMLVEFGRIIAYVIESTETKRGLLADHRTEVELDVIDGDDLLHAIAAELGMTLRFEGVVPQADDHSLLYFCVEGVSTDVVSAAAAEISGIESLRDVTQQSDTTLFEARVSGPLLAETLVDCGALPTRIETDGKRQQVVVTIPQTTDVRTVINRLQAEYPSTTVVSRRDYDGEIRTQSTYRMGLLDGLTQRQRETLRAAYFARYFESPRGSTGTEVGASLGISQPTFTYHLRTALRTLLTTLFEADADRSLDN